MNQSAIDRASIDLSSDAPLEESLDDGRIVFDPSERTRHVTRDPVCGVGLPAEAGPTVRYHGVDYYFCGEDCKKTFLADPQRYTGIKE